MSNKENEFIAKNDLPDFEDEVTVRIGGTPEGAPAIAEESLAVSEPAVVEEAPKPEYGAPQPLFEDIIPAERTPSKIEIVPDKKAEKEAAAAAKKAEKDAEKEAKKAEKEAKKKAKIAALIAAVESEAEAKAKKEYEEETGEPYDDPTPEPVAVADAPVAPDVQQPEKEVPAPKASAQSNPPKQYSSGEKKLRKRYKMAKDVLLSSNDVIPGFVIAKGENVIRSYQCLAAKKGCGMVTLTNRRLLVDAGERSEIEIDKVSGIKFCKYANFHFFRFLFWLIFFGLGALMTALPFIKEMVEIPGITGESWQDWFSILFYICGPISLIISIPFFFTMLKKTFYFYIYAREESPFLECKNGSYAKRERKGKVYKYTLAKAGKESEKAARELGALIIEAKDGRYNF